MTNITTNELRLKMTKVVCLIRDDLYLVSRYEYPYKLCLRNRHINKGRPEYIVENLSRKEMSIFLDKLYYLMNKVQPESHA